MSDRLSSDGQKQRESSSQPWYGDGLRFTCTQCGNCCSGSPGFVWVNQSEIEAIAASIKISDVDEFEKLYVRRIGARKSLKEFPNGDCLFLDEKTRGCKVYKVRPRQCRTWPFWDSNLADENQWQETCRVCPGAGQGELYDLTEIESRRKVMKL